MQFITSIAKRARDLLTMWRQLNAQSGAMCEIETTSYIAYASAKNPWFPQFTASYREHVSRWPIHKPCNSEDHIEPIINFSGRNANLLKRSKAVDGEVYFFLNHTLHV